MTNVFECRSMWIKLHKAGHSLMLTHTQSHAAHYSPLIHITLFCLAAGLQALKYEQLTVRISNNLMNAF